MSVSDTSLTERRKIVKEKVLWLLFYICWRWLRSHRKILEWCSLSPLVQKESNTKILSSWDTKRFSNAWMFIVDSLSRIIFFSSRKKLWNLKYFLTSVSKERKEMKLSSFFSDAFLSIDWRVSFNNLLLLLHPEIFSSVIHKVFSFLTLRFSEFRTLCSEENSDQMLIKS